MFRVDACGASRYCDGLERRSFIQLGLAGMATAGMPDLLKAKAISEASGNDKKNTSIILLWLDGGPSHLDTYDMKPEAPAEYRGIWNPIKTNVPGIDVTEFFPRHAKVADKFSIIRSIHHDQGDHFAGGHYMLTGRGGASGGNKPIKFPSIGSIASKLLGARRSAMIPYVSVPVASSIGLRPGYFGGHFLGGVHDPFETSGDPNNDDFSVGKFAVPNEMTIEQLDDRQHLLTSFDQFRRAVETPRVYDSMDRFKREAYDMIARPAVREAFQISNEDAKLREKYGRHTWGQSTLLARRLVEAGALFVTVHFGGWDNHWNLEGSYKNYLPKVDAAVSSLLEDLDSRGLLDQVLVLVAGEFGRTPKMNNGHNGKGTPGRDHWGRALSVLAAGGGVQGGRVVGATNARGEHPVENLLRPTDLHATMLHVLGLDPNLQIQDLGGRPHYATDHGRVIHELFV